MRHSEEEEKEEENEDDEEEEKKAIVSFLVRKQIVKALIKCQPRFWIYCVAPFCEGSGYDSV